MKSMPSDQPTVEEIIRNDTSNAIIKHTYLEKGKEVTRYVYPLTFTTENLNKLWIAAKPFRTIFGHEHDDDFIKFVSFFLDLSDPSVARAKGLFWIVDDFLGLFYISDITPNVDASVHFTFFDGAFQRRKPLIVAALRYGFQHYNLHRFSTEVPHYVKVPLIRDNDGKVILDSNGKPKQKFNAFKAVESLGFKYEGKRREVRPFDNKFFDVNIYGLLRSEFNQTYGL